MLSEAFLNPGKKTIKIYHQRRFRTVIWIFNHESGQTIDMTDSFLDTIIEEDSCRICIWTSRKHNLGKVVGKR